MCARKDAAETNLASVNSVPRMPRASVISAIAQRDLIGCKLSGPALLSVVQDRSGMEMHAFVRRAMPGSAKCASHAQLHPSLSMKNACASTALTG